METLLNQKDSPVVIVNGEDINEALTILRDRLGSFWQVKSYRGRWRGHGKKIRIHKRRERKLSAHKKKQH